MANGIHQELPDVVVIPLSEWGELRNREAVIELNESPPLLVVEVVSESTKTNCRLSSQASLV
ncbi:MAG: hypothetical protein V7K38_03815 [Nostoc sp.]